MYDYPMRKRFPLLLASFIALTGCGGDSDFPPSVSAIKGQTLQFGKIAVINVGGQFLRKDMIAQTGACANPAFRSDSTTTLAVLTCTINSIGDFPVSIKSANGDLLYSTTLNVSLPQVIIVTSQGNIVAELNADVVPKTVSNFLSYVNSGFYAGTLVHRVEPGFVIQGGGYSTGLVNKSGKLAPIALESNKGLSNLRGTLAMARTNVEDSATSEFYFNLADNTRLDYISQEQKGYAVFGKILQGTDVMDKIATVATGAKTSSQGVEFQNLPTTDVVINLILQTK